MCCSILECVLFLSIVTPDSLHEWRMNVNTGIRDVGIFCACVEIHSMFNVAAIKELSTFLLIRPIWNNTSFIEVCEIIIRTGVPALFLFQSYICFVHFHQQSATSLFIYILICCLLIKRQTSKKQMKVKCNDLDNQLDTLSQLLKEKKSS